ncbi:uncharacterized protein LOC108672962 [Hyalella azteca]|uniref:Uncharacterized protein LOC108672962 n=1 Tax=Hyalella azteca TaxID=294128 RepID=A0A8B7NR54_HYAAZ|nr:uncharacterized protein LOC108672962 [Hyalella azteca]
MLNGDVDSSSWNATTSVQNFPHDRLPGANLSYKCLGEFYMEGNVFEDRTFQGNVTCLSGNPPRWDRNVTLPCSFGCTDDYVESTTADECYKFMEDPKATSFLNAAYRCTAQGANLVRLRSGNLNLSISESEYYTAHGSRYKFDNPSNPSNEHDCWSSSTSNGDGRPNGCIILKNKTQLSCSNCWSNIGYACMKPAVCPTKYVRAGTGGSCYYIRDRNIAADVTYGYFLSELASLQQNCSATGGALARPTSLSDLESLVKFIQKQDGPYPMNVVLGLASSVDDNWSFDAFPRDAALESLFKASAWGVAVLQVNQTSYNFSTGPTTIHKYVCMWPGHLRCDSDPPPATQNMTRDINTEKGEFLKATGNSAVYKCFPGYFINGNTSNPVRQRYWCVGNAGNWRYDSTKYTELQNCSKVPVCQSLVEAERTNFTAAGISAANVTMDDPEYVNGTMNYTCPYGASTSSGKRFQSRKCIIVNPKAVDVAQNFTLTGDPFEPCAPCKATPPCPGSNMTWDKNFTNAIVGTVVNYNCSPDYFYGTDDNMALLSDASVRCNESGLWQESPNFKTDCFHRCNWVLDKWDNSHFSAFTNDYKYFPSDTLDVVCDFGYEWALDKRSQTIKCNDHGWDLSQLKTCVRACEINDVNITNAVSNHQENASYTNGSMLNVSCKDGYEWKFKERVQNVTCAASGWDTTRFQPCYLGK